MPPKVTIETSVCRDEDGLHTAVTARLMVNGPDGSKTLGGLIELDLFWVENAYAANLDILQEADDIGPSVEGVVGALIDEKTGMLKPELGAVNHNIAVISVAEVYGDLHHFTGFHALRKLLNLLEPYCGIAAFLYAGKSPGYVDFRKDGTAFCSLLQYNGHLDKFGFHWAPGDCYWAPINSDLGWWLLRDDDDSVEEIGPLQL